MPRNSLYGWPCKACGAEGPTPEGHDPCIANLPGVKFACCGHGIGRGYACFEDGRVIRGAFERTPAEFDVGWPLRGPKVSPK